MVTQTNQGTAVVTGASTGIGAIYADRLARRGYDLILIARDRAKLDNLAREITDDTRRSVEVVAADLADKKDLAGVEAKQTLPISTNNGAGRQHLRVKQRPARHQAMEDTTMPVSPIHHGRHRKASV